MRGNSLRLLCSAVYFAGLLGFGTSSASAAVQDRVTTAVNSSNLVAIPDSVQPKARQGSDLGPTSGGTKLQGMSIRFSMTADQQAALDQLLANQQNPSSPQYHQWLTPQQFAAQFGLSSGDIAKVTAWLTSEGFTVTGVANGGTFVTFDGTVAQAEAAFGTSIHNVSYKGETHFANVSNIQVPSAFSGVVADVVGLHNFRLQPHVHTHVVTPNYTSSVSGSHYLAPGDVYAIYQMDNLLTGGTNGTGEAIAVVGQVDIYAADITAFRSASGLSTTTLPTTVHAGGCDPGYPTSMSFVCNGATFAAPTSDDLSESSIDLEWSSAMAPGATVTFVNAACALLGTGCGTDAMTWAIDNNLAPIVTTSYGACEAAWGSNDISAMEALFKQANSQGQTILAAAGDTGATDCDTGTSAVEGLAVDFPGSSPYVTAMGGTSYNDGTATGATQYWLGSDNTFTANPSITGATYSASGYIPETTWNDITYGYIGGGGGGASAYFTKPAWQQGTGVPADGSRDTPDLALNASDIHDSFLYCVNVALGDSCTSGYRISNNDLTAAGGTSFDSQLFGGMLALVEQKLASRLGNINPTIYAFANSSKYYAAGATIASNSNVVFNDVTSGNNSIPCTSGSTECPNGGSIGYNAGSGYDQATGWGSVNLANLANGWAGVTALSSGSLGSNTSTTQLCANGQCTVNSFNVTAGATVTLTATVSGSASAAPTGTVQFYANNIALGSPVTLTTTGSVTTATYSFVTSCSYLGQQSMSASYSGDTNYQGSKGPALAAGEAGNSGGAGVLSNGSVVTTPLLINIATNSCPDFSIAPSGSGVTVTGSTGTLTVAAGGTIPSVTITATPANGFTGTVSFTATSTANSNGYSPTLTFSPTSVNITNTTAQSTTLAFTGITAELHFPALPGHADPLQRKPSRTPWYLAGTGATLACLLLMPLPRRRRLGGLLVLLLAVAVVGGVSGCGSSQTGPPSTSSSSGSSNPYVGTYVVTVTGTYTASGGQVTVHSATITYNIN